MTKIVGIRFRTAGKIYYFDPADFDLDMAMHVIVETARGIEMGTVLIPPKEVDDDKVVSPLKPVIRVATDEDEKTVERNKEKEKEARDYMERVFPGGEKEREQVRQELTKRLPEKDEMDLLLCYVHIRDRMTGTGLSFEQVAGEVEKLQWIPDMDQKSLDAIREVMEQVCAEHKK